MSDEVQDEVSLSVYIHVAADDEVMSVPAFDAGTPLKVGALVVRALPPSRTGGPTTIEFGVANPGVKTAEDLPEALEELARIVRAAIEQESN